MVLMKSFGPQSSRIKLVGIGFICVGIASYGSGILWFATRADRPVNVPISMAVGHVRTPGFKVNRNAIYTIKIEVKKNIPFDTLNCLLGTAASSTELQECRDRPSVVKASWVLSSDGQTVAHGSTDDYRDGDWRNDSISRFLGAFRSQNGRPYVLDLDVLADGSALGAGQPHLKVEVSSAVYETEIVEDAILSFSTMVAVLIGVILLLISFFRNRRTRNTTAPAAFAGRS
jgi:hypothetical protein